MEKEPFSLMPRDWRQWGIIPKLAYWAVFFGLMVPVNLTARAFAHWLFP